MRIRLKICGITTPDTGITAANEGADAIGFVFAKSPRQITVKRALEVAHYVPVFVTRVAVMRNPTADVLAEVLAGFSPDVLQAEPTETVLRATKETNTTLLPVLHDDDTLAQQIRSLEATDLPHKAVILEGRGQGGRGVSADWSHAASVAKRFPLILAGGLTTQNVEAAIRRVQPFGVDVSSGVEETPGVKSQNLISTFAAAVRRAECNLQETIQSGPTEHDRVVHNDFGR